MSSELGTHSALGIFLRRHRKDLGMDQTGVAEASGISKSNLSRIERGEAELNPRNEKGLARALGIHRHDLHQFYGNSNRISFTESLILERLDEVRTELLKLQPVYTPVPKDFVPEV